jgi:hypothetical protein
MVHFDGRFACDCAWPNREPEEDDIPVEGDDNVPLG